MLVLKNKVLLNFITDYYTVTYQISLTKSLCNKQTNLMCNINHPKFPCRVCAKSVHDKEKAVQCDLCELWIYIKCNNLNYFEFSSKLWWILHEGISTESCIITSVMQTKNIEKKNLIRIDIYCKLIQHLWRIPDCRCPEQNYPEALKVWIEDKK